MNSFSICTIQTLISCFKGVIKQINRLVRTKLVLGLAAVWGVYAQSELVTGLKAMALLFLKANTYGEKFVTVSLLGLTAYFIVFITLTFLNSLSKLYYRSSI